MRHPSNRWKWQIGFIVSLCSIGIGLAGCDQLGGSTLSKPVLAIDPTDPCQQERKELATSKSYFSDQIIANVGGGALIGAAVGSIGGAMFGVDPLKAGAIGAGVGAAAGGISSYSNIMMQKHKDKTELSKSVNDDLTKEGQEIDHTSASFARLRTCRFQQATLIKTQVSGRMLDRQIAMQQLNLEKAWFVQEIALAKEYKVSMEKRGQQFKEAADTIGQQQAADAAQTQAIKHAAGVSNPDKRASFGDEINNAEKSSDIAFNLDNNKKVSSLKLAQHV